MKITILQQAEYPSPEEYGAVIGNHLTFIKNSDKGYETSWGRFNKQTEDRLKEKLDDGVILPFRYDYDDKTNA